MSDKLIGSSGLEIISLSEGRLFEALTARWSISRRLLYGKGNPGFFTEGLSHVTYSMGDNPRDSLLRSFVLYHDESYAWSSVSVTKEVNQKLLDI